MKILDIIKEDGVYWEPNNKAGNVGTENPFGKPQQSTVKAASGQAASKNSDLNLDGPYYAPDNNAGAENPFGSADPSTIQAAFGNDQTALKKWQQDQQALAKRMEKYKQAQQRQAAQAQRTVQQPAQQAAQQPAQRTPAQLAQSKQRAMANVTKQIQTLQAQQNELNAMNAQKIKQLQGLLQRLKQQ